MLQASTRQRCTRVSRKACLTLCDPMDRQAPLTTEFSRQKHWTGLPFTSPGDLPDPGIEAGSSALQAGYILEAQRCVVLYIKEAPALYSTVTS